MKQEKLKQLFMLCLFGMISIGASAEEIPNDEIWYTSSNGAVITPQGTIDFGANIISNTYDNGKGIIKYDGNVTSIGYQAFYYCSRLTSVTIPNSVTSIGYQAFFYCSGLTSVTIPNSVTSIGSEAFNGCSGLTSVTIPNSVIEIGDGAFYDCSGLRSVTIGNSLERIGSHAFDNCWKLTSVTIPNSVTEIGGRAFYFCSGLTSVTIPNSVTSIGSEAFNGCSGLASIKVESGNTVYDSRDNCNAIIETASNRLISGCKNTIIPNSVTSIGSSAFSRCSRLTSVTIPNSVTEIGEWAFNKCSGLTSVTIPNSVTEIGDRAFRECSGLTSVTIPNSVTSIGFEAFYNCSGLRSVYVGWTEDKKIPSITSSYTFPFSACNLYVPYGTKSIYQGKSYWKNFMIIIEPSDQTITISEAKYGTFASRYAAKIPEGVSAYKATVDGSTVTMTKIQDGVIPGDCGVILYAAQGDYTFAPNAEVEQVEDNQLVAVTENTYTCTGDDVGKVYYLGLDNGGKATFVCLNSNGTIPVGKAYLKLDAALDAGAKLDVVFGDEPTGIEEVQGSRFKVQGSVYNFNGVRVNKDYKGIIIVNGKKYMNK